MKQSSILAFYSLLAFAAAAPFVNRDLVTVVVTEEVIETIDMTTTVWLAAGGAPTVPTSSANSGHGNPVSPASSTSTSTSSPVAAAVSQAVSSTPPAQYSVPQSSSSTSSSSSATSIISMSSASPTSTTSTTAPPSSTSSASAYTAPAPTTTSTPQASTSVQPVSYAATSCLPYPNPATTAGVIPGAYFPPSCNSTSGGCSGDITYYDVGMGACGITSSADQPVIAVSYLMMGTASNSNPLCGKTVTIKNANTGASAQATVVDKCMGCCDHESIDLSDSLFETLNGGSLAAGRVSSGITWYFND
ncbi:MAG: hypothetical protein FRX48_05986 [Lasallia pustulata]|uniref:Barwin-like endoglucanase n=1 Tax=Lasallia pustulata TaxID=136370 RepID=A0A5M8PPF5_9LECA|nr:MAG: hypothetical protein FRX48_05986 [Lasallia pustulata]